MLLELWYCLVCITAYCGRNTRLTDSLLTSIAINIGVAVFFSLLLHENILPYLATLASKAQILTIESFNAISERITHNTGSALALPRLLIFKDILLAMMPAVVLIWYFRDYPLTCAIFNAAPGAEPIVFAQSQLTCAPSQETAPVSPLEPTTQSPLLRSSQSVFSRIAAGPKRRPAQASIDFAAPRRYWSRVQSDTRAAEWTTATPAGAHTPSTPRKQERSMKYDVRCAELQIWSSRTARPSPQQKTDEHADVLPPVENGQREKVEPAAEEAIAPAKQTLKALVVPDKDVVARVPTGTDGILGKKWVVIAACAAAAPPEQKQKSPPACLSAPQYESKPASPKVSLPIPRQDLELVVRKRSIAAGVEKKTVAFAPGSKGALPSAAPDERKLPLNTPSKDVSIESGTIAAPHNGLSIISKTSSVLELADGNGKAMGLERTSGSPAAPSETTLALKAPMNELSRRDSKTDFEETPGNSSSTTQSGLQPAVPGSSCTAKQTASSGLSLGPDQFMPDAPSAGIADSGDIEMRDSSPLIAKVESKDQDMEDSQSSPSPAKVISMEFIMKEAPSTDEASEQDVHMEDGARSGIELLRDSAASIDDNVVDDIIMSYEDSSSAGLAPLPELRKRKRALSDDPCTAGGFQIRISKRLQPEFQPPISAAQKTAPSVRVSTPQFRSNAYTWIRKDLMAINSILDQIGSGVGPSEDQWRSDLAQSFDKIRQYAGYDASLEPARGWRWKDWQIADDAGRGLSQVANEIRDKLVAYRIRECPSRPAGAMEWIEQLSRHCLIIRNGCKLPAPEQGGKPVAASVVPSTSGKSLAYVTATDSISAGTLSRMSFEEISTKYGFVFESMTPLDVILASANSPSTKSAAMIWYFEYYCDQFGKTTTSKEVMGLGRKFLVPFARLLKWILTSEGRWHPKKVSTRIARRLVVIVDSILAMRIVKSNSQTFKATVIQADKLKTSLDEMATGFVDDDNDDADDDNCNGNNGNNDEMGDQTYPSSEALARGDHETTGPPPTSTSNSEGFVNAQIRKIGDGSSILKRKSTHDDAPEPSRKKLDGIAKKDDQPLLQIFSPSSVVGVKRDCSSSPASEPIRRKLNDPFEMKDDSTSVNPCKD